jgi:hypothetical protein
MELESAVPERTMGLTVVAVLALVQSALGVLRTLHWFDAGSDLLGQGLLLLPLIGVLAFSALFLWPSSFALCMFLDSSSSNSDLAPVFSASARRVFPSETEA